MPVMEVTEQSGFRSEGKAGAESRALEEVNMLRLEKPGHTSLKGAAQSTEASSDSLPKLKVIDRSKENQNTDIPAATSTSFRMETITAATANLKQRQQLSDDDIYLWRAANLAYGVIDTALAGASASGTVLFGGVAVADIEPTTKVIAAGATVLFAGATLSAGYAAIGRFRWAFAGKEEIENLVFKRKK